MIRRLTPLITNAEWKGIWEHSDLFNDRRMYFTTRKLAKREIRRLVMAVLRKKSWKKPRGENGEI